MFKNIPVGTSLVVQQLRLRIPNAGGLGSIPGQRTSDPISAWTTYLNRHFTNKKRMFNEPIKRCSTILVSEKMQINAIGDTTSHPLE